MARENFAAAFDVLGQGLGQLAGYRMEMEARKIEALRQQSLEDLRHRQNLEMQERSFGFQSELQAENRAADAAREEARMAREDTRTAEERKFRGELVGREENLQRERWTREDMRNVEAQASQQIEAINERIQSLQDSLLKGEFMDPSAEGTVNAELEELRRQKLDTRARMIFSLAEQGDPRYKDMTTNERLVSAGFSRDQIRDWLNTRAAPGQSGDPGDPGLSEGAASTTQPPPLSPGGDLGRSPREAVRETATGAGTGAGTGVAAANVNLFSEEQASLSPWVGKVGGAISEGVAKLGETPPKGFAEVGPEASRVVNALRAGTPPSRADVEKLAGASDSALREHGFTAAQIEWLRSLDIEPPASPSVLPDLGKVGRSRRGRNAR